MITTAQIIILGTFFVLYCISLYFTLKHNTKNEQLPSIMGSFFIFGITLCILVIISMNNNDLREKVKGKCPELEKVENVYRIK